MVIDRSKPVTAVGLLLEPTLNEVVLRPPSQDEDRLAATPALPGCTGEGETEPGAIEDVRPAALERADAALADGEVVPAPARPAAAAAAE